MEKLFRLTDEQVVKKTTTESIPHEFCTEKNSYHLLSKYEEHIQYILKTEGVYRDESEDTYGMNIEIKDEHILLGCEVYKDADGILFIPFSAVSKSD